MNTVDNPPQIGRCDACSNLTIRLLNSPLVQLSVIEIDSADLDEVWFQDSPIVPASLYTVVERCDDGTLICLAPEAVRNARYCWKCFDGHIWPGLRRFVINMPQEIQHNPDHPWWNPRWVSIGREKRRL